jgi:hypothetical protein
MAVLDLAAGSQRFSPGRMKRPLDARVQPAPSNPGITRQMVRLHAHRLFRDKWPRQPLTLREWRLAEQDLVRTLEAEAF